MQWAAIVLIPATLLAQGWGRREAMRPWLQGRFADAERAFAQRRSELPGFALALLWEAEFETERGRFGLAAAMIKRAAEIRTGDEDGLPERRMAQLLFAVGQFSKAERAALKGQKWDGKDPVRLKLSSPIDLLTVGEIAMVRGEYSLAASILNKARDKSKNGSSVFGYEWVRAQNDVALAHLNSGSLQAASEAVELALREARAVWGPGSIPETDALDTLGLVQISQRRFDDAVRSLEQSRTRREELYYSGHPKIASNHIHAALLCAARNQKTEALQFLQHGLDIERSLAVGLNARWALALLTAAEIYQECGEPGEAKSLYANALPVLEGELGADAPRLISAHQRYRGLLDKN